MGTQSCDELRTTYFTEPLMDINCKYSRFLLYSFPLFIFLETKLKLLTNRHVDLAQILLRKNYKYSLHILVFSKELFRLSGCSIFDSLPI